MAHQPQEKLLPKEVAAWEAEARRQAQAELAAMEEDARMQAMARAEKEVRG